MPILLPKVGHALRDRTALLEKIMLEPQKTRRELKTEGFSVLRYAELLIRGKIPPLRRRHPVPNLDNVAAYNAAASNLLVNNSRDAERNSADYQQQQAAIAARQDVIARNAATVDFISKATAANTVDITNDYDDSSTEQRQHSQQSNMRQSNQRGQASIPVNPPANARKKTINDIVVPAMKSGNLPYGGYWKFFPLPEVQDSIDLGPLKGWKLKLEPISFAAKAIILDVDL
jgi:hypothetical protein